MKDGKTNPDSFLLVLYIIIGYSIFAFILTELLKTALIDFITCISSKDGEFEQHVEEAQIESFANPIDAKSPPKNKIIEDDRPIDIPEF